MTVIYIQQSGDKFKFDEIQVTERFSYKNLLETVGIVLEIR